MCVEVNAPYLITFACYGAWLPGQLGSIDLRNNAFGSRLPEPDAEAETRAGTG